MFCGSRESKSVLSKAANAEPSGQLRLRFKICASFWRSGFGNLNSIKNSVFLYIVQYIFTHSCIPSCDTATHTSTVYQYVSSKHECISDQISYIMTSTSGKSNTKLCRKITLFTGTN